MTGHRSFKGLTKDWPAKRRLRVQQRTADMLCDIEQAALDELRKALQISQDELATLLGRSQAAIAQMEQRTDIKVSTLREVIQALGGELELVARFPKGEVKITRLGEAADA